MTPDFLSGMLAGAIAAAFAFATLVLVLAGWWRARR